MEVGNTVLEQIAHEYSVSIEGAQALVNYHVAQHQHHSTNDLESYFGIGDSKMADTPSGVTGTLNGKTLGQGFIDKCNEIGAIPETDENYTVMPGGSIALTDKGILTWTPAGGVLFIEPAA